MIKIPSPLAEPVAQSADLSSKAQDLVTSQQTPDQCVATLERNGLQADACKFMAYGMSERDAVCYATQSAQKAVDPSNLADQEAVKAAQAWMNAPSEATQKAAAAAADAADHASPGAWAAQAAAFAQVPPAGPAVPGAPNLTQYAAWGAIQLAAVSPADRAQAAAQMAQARAEAAAKSVVDPAALPEVPAVPQVDVPDPVAPVTAAKESLLTRFQTAKAYQPYSDLGKSIANGTCTC